MSVDAGTSDPADVLRAPVNPTGEAACPTAYIIGLGSQGHATRLLLRWPLSERRYDAGPKCRRAFDHAVWAA